MGMKIRTKTVKAIGLKMRIREKMKIGARMGIAMGLQVRMVLRMQKLD
jgi:hypothetical protein